MRRIFLIAVFLVSACCGFSQQVETSRYEVIRWGKDQGCRFESFHENGGMMVYATDQTDEDKNRLWNFVALDSSLYEMRSDLIPLPGKMKLFDTQSSSRWAAFVFVDEKSTRSDSIPFIVVTYDRQEQSFAVFSDRLPERSVVLSTALMDDNLMLAVNGKSGKGFLLLYDLDSHQHRVITPNIDNDFILFQLAMVQEGKAFVVAAREFVEKRYKATSFLVFSREGRLLQSHRYENVEGSALGRMCYAFDASHQLLVYATLERESNKKVNVEGMTENFDRTAVGVAWVKFASNGTQTKTYLFKDLPDIEMALTPSDRLRVREELLQMQRGKKKERGEIALQFITPRLTHFGDLKVFAAEAFRPVFHTETRMEYGFYGTYPLYYTVFDGYDFFSEILLAFDDEGCLQWHTSVRFENDLAQKLTPHSAEAVSHDELVVVSPCRNVLRYEVFDKDGAQLLDQHAVKLDFLNGADTFEDEYEAEVFKWYDDRFLVHGCQILQNGIQRTPRRTVFYVQKVQYE